MPLPQRKEKYTYQDYCQWPDDERWELIGGVAYNMTPAPSFRHQTILINLGAIFRVALKGKTCVPGAAPTDVVLSEEDVVQPDLFIVCDRQKITEKNIQGAPDVIVEILSPSTSKKDRWDKRALYEKFGVNEYLLVYPEGKYMERFLLGEDGLFDHGQAFEEQDALQLKTVADVEISLPDVFAMDFLDESDHR
ncbi:MAG: Uma2 family endonuclease [Candidatus Omnitrophica bacterium]|nr:Uma2 family endonuclease [Candidatus Omnitrophota bacterium]